MQGGVSAVTIREKGVGIPSVCFCLVTVKVQANPGDSM
jgi:hypothetical protein